MLRTYTTKLNKHPKLLSNFYSLSHLNRTIPTLHHSNIRLIQSIIHNNTFQSINSSFNTLYPNKSFHKSHFNPLQIFNKRSFSLPEHEIIGLPALSPSVEESKIVSWNANEGDFIAADTSIASVQTDKAELDWMVTDDVYLAKILLEPGIQVPVGTPVCIFVDDKTHINAFKNYSSQTQTQTQTQSETPSTPEKSKPITESIDTTNYPEHKIEGMPALSPTAIDGALVEWLVKEGDMIEEGTGIAEIQTDKSIVTWTSTDDAYIAKLLVPVAPDNKLTVGTPLAILVEDKNYINAFKNYNISQTQTQTHVKTEEQKAKDINIIATGRQSSIQFRYGLRETPKPRAMSSDRIFASPYAKKLAKEMGISLDKIGNPSGGNNRIIGADIIKASQTQTQPPKKEEEMNEKRIEPIDGWIISSDRSYEDIPVSVMREIIGQRLSESKFTSPHFYVTMECIMDNLIGMRTEININENENENINKISINDFIIKACALSLRDIPMCNVGWISDENTNETIIRKYNYIDISVAVATPNGLITPIIKDANKKSLNEISIEMKYLAKKAKENKLLPQEFQGGTFTISNMGMFGISNFTAIINPPQSCILAVGGTKNKLVADKNNQKGFKNVNTMEITLSSDHRSVDGALAAMLINSIQKYIEKPAKLMR